MKKIVLLLILMLSIFSLNCTKVNSQIFNSSQKYDNKANNNSGNKVEINYLEGKGDYANCDGLITQEGLDIIKEILGWIRIIAPILVILLIALDLSSAVLSQDNDALGKATKKIVPRLIGVALLFFVPTIIRAILSLDGVNDAIAIPDDPLCHTMVSQEVVKDYSLII